ncbi:MAG: response regulator [Acidobacteria bacterium]|nr:response regulator [Acidobacteriota bacterium]
MIPSRAPRTAAVLAALSILTSCPRPPRNSAPIRSVSELTRLSESELSSGHRVALRGVVTLLDPDWRLLAVQDASGGVLVEWPGSPLNLRLGASVEVIGASAVDNYVPSVVHASVRRIGEGEQPPTPVRTEPSSLACGGGLYRLVEVEFRPEEASFGDGSHTATFATRGPCGGLAAIGQVFRKYSPSSLAGKRLRVRGVPLASYSPSGELTQVRLMFESDADVDVLEPPTQEKPAAGGAPLHVLGSIQAVKALPREEAARGYTARVEGVVTAINSRHDGFFIQDGDTGMCVFLTEGRSPPPLGHRVRLTGRTEKGGFAPVVRQEAIEVLGPAPLPIPAKVVPGDIFHGWEENRWVEIEGVGVSVASEGTSHQLELFSGCGRVLVWFSDDNAPQRLLSLLDAKVVIHGVYSPLFTAQGALLGFRIFSTSPAAIRIVTPPQRDALPRTIASLSHFDPAGHPEQRIRVTGSVTYRDTHGRVNLQDGGVSLGVIGGALPPPPVNSRATVEGFLSPDSRAPQLEQIRWLDASPGDPVQPVRILADSLASGGYDGRLVSVEGFLENRQTSAGELQLHLAAGRFRFMASLDAPDSRSGFPDLRPGALLRLSGVCATSYAGDLAEIRTSRLWMRDARDIVILRPAPWLDLRRALYLASAASLMLVLALAWVAWLRHRIVVQMEIRSRLEEQLVHAQRLEGIGRLAGGIAHDFNNYLTVILGYSSLLLDIPSLQGSVRRHLSAIRDVGEKAAALTHQLLAFSRKQVLQPVPCDLNEIIVQAKGTLLPLIGEHIEIEIREGLIELVSIDPAQFLRVLVNLAVNARDAMPNGGRLIFETSGRQIGAGHPALADGLRPGRYVCVSVTDTGVGMDAQTASHIFDPFFTTKGPGRGTGLGLAAVFGIVKQSHGHIEVQSSPGHGACFIIHLPVVGPLEPRRDPEALSTHQPGCERILVVEDQESVRSLVREGLELNGYQVTEARTPQDALDLLADPANRFHLLLTDVVMPEMSGPELADQAKARRPDLRVLFMSGYLADDSRGVPGNAVYLEKPFTAAQVTVAVRRALASK